MGPKRFLYLEKISGIELEVVSQLFCSTTLVKIKLVRLTSWGSCQILKKHVGSGEADAFRHSLFSCSFKTHLFWVCCVLHSVLCVGNIS